MSGAIPPLGLPRRSVRPVDERFPLVVYDNTKTGLTAATSTTELFRAEPTRIYRVTQILWVTTGGDAINLTPAIGYTDRVGATTGAPFAAFSLAAAARQFGSLVFENVSGAAITIATSLSGARAVSVWSLRTIVEQLS